MKVQSIKKGFTLIELLVVITIIGILATGGVSVFTTQLQGARDSTRINDMKLMETAIYQTFSDQGEYPPITTFTGAISGYMSKELADPKAGDTICWQEAATVFSNDYTCGGYYVRTNDSFGLTNSAFKLAIAFEKKVNTQNRSPDDGGTSTTLFETFAWADSDQLTVWSGGTGTPGDGADMSSFSGSVTWAANGSSLIY